MNTRRCLIGLSMSIALLAALPQVASAQVAGGHQGVTAAQGRHGAVLRFGKGSGATYRRIAGRHVVIGCATVSRGIGGYSVDSEAESSLRAPRRRQTLRIGDIGKVDYCFVRLSRTHETVVMAPLTRAGRTYIDELQTFVLMMFVPFGSVADPGAPMPTIDQAVADGHGLVVALDGPDATPPHGKAGYWTDGTTTVVAALTAAGRRMFFEVEGDVVRTNAMAYITGLSGG